MPQPIGFMKEYFCICCGQLRLNLDAARTSCVNCGAEGEDLLIGEPNSLDKDKLKKMWVEAHNE